MPGMWGHLRETARGWRERKGYPLQSLRQPESEQNFVSCLSFDQKSDEQRRPYLLWPGRTMRYPTLFIWRKLPPGLKIGDKDRRKMMQGRGGKGSRKGNVGRGAGKGGRGERSQKEGFGKGPSGECVCPSCGKKAPHERGVPCTEVRCPECGTAMTRE